MKASADSSTAIRTPRSPDISGTPRPERIRLDGPTRPLDPRVHAYRKDIADIALAGRMFAPHYAAASRCRLRTGATMLRAGPSPSAQAVSQILPGEDFFLLDSVLGWAWGQTAHDRYVGYVPANCLGPVEEPSHRVAVPLALVFAAPDIKAPVVDSLPIGARFAGEPEGRFLATAAGYVHERHAAPLDATMEPVALAARLIGQPYLWGGRGGGGIDCSGLVQLACAFAGIQAPRDSDMQRESLGVPLAEDDALRRGDLVFFPGHVGWMADATTLLHANAFHMAVIEEPLADVVARLAPDHPEPILARRRL